MRVEDHLQEEEPRCWVCCLVAFVYLLFQHFPKQLVVCTVILTCYVPVPSVHQYIILKRLTAVDLPSQQILFTIFAHLGHEHFLLHYLYTNIYINRPIIISVRASFSLVTFLTTAAIFSPALCETDAVLIMLNTPLGVTEMLHRTAKRYR